MTRVLVLASAALLLPLAACHSAGSHSASAHHDSAATLRQLDDQWSAAAQARDVEKVASFYADDAIAFPPGEPVAKGKAAAKKVWADALAEPSFHISWKSTDAGVAGSGEMGYTCGTYNASFTGPDGKPGTEAGKFLCVWRKQANGEWKAVRDMWNADAR